jgi:endogenous inhibitor of DNA gyrase (YacG/DUF329 family)
MARRTRDDDFEDDPEGPGAWDVDDDAGASDDVGTVDCPRCGREISEYAEQCPRCGTYVSEEESPRSGFPKWAVIAAAFVLAAMAVAMFRGIF